MTAQEPSSAGFYNFKLPPPPTPTLARKYIYGRAQLTVTIAYIYCALTLGWMLCEDQMEARLMLTAAPGACVTLPFHR